MLCDMEAKLNAAARTKDPDEVYAVLGEIEAAMTRLEIVLKTYGSTSCNGSEGDFPVGERSIRYRKHYLERLFAKAIWLAESMDEEYSHAVGL